MKKVFGIFMVLSLMSNISFAQEMSCGLWAYGATKAEEEAYGEMGLQEFADAHDYYQGICEDAGGSGNIEGPVFL